MEKKFIPMPLNDKNIMTDAFAEELFDNGNCSEYARRAIFTGWHTMLGFIGGSPYMVKFTFGDNTIYVTDIERGGFGFDDVLFRLQDVLPNAIIEHGANGQSVNERYFKFYYKE
jgi:hypothetical protein